MPHIIAELYREQRALRADGAAIIEAAEASGSGAMTAEQSARFDAIKARSSHLDTLIDDAVAALDHVPGASGAQARGFEAGREQGRAAAHAEIVALLEVCVARDAKASVILGLLKAKTSAADALIALGGSRAPGTELIGRASWDAAIGEVNRRFLT